MKSKTTPVRSSSFEGVSIDFTETDIQGAYANVARKNKDAFFKIQKLRPLEIVKKARFYEFLFALG